MNVLSIDAWRQCEGGWTWNNWHLVGTAPDDWAHLPARALLRKLRDEGYNIVVNLRATGEPLLALAYGEAQS